VKILHVFRTPVGGLFRHVRDLARGQAEAGHEVGILCDSSTGGAMAETLLAEIVPACQMGIRRVPISRLPGFSDMAAIHLTRAFAGETGAQIIHGHGAKGGLYGRMAAHAMGLPSVYTPHGGSLHYSWRRPPGALFLASERFLARRGSGLVFVCQYEKQVFDEKIGLGTTPSAVVYNGLWPQEFTPVEPAPDASDVVFIGDLRYLKGVDVLIEALAFANQQRPVTAALVGDGPDMEAFRRLTEARGLTACIRFLGRMPTQQALRQGRLLVIPSRAESFPYVVLEAVAARLPVIGSAVGGIPEILPADNLVPPGEVQALARRIALAASAPHAFAGPAEALAQAAQQRFSVSRMSAEILRFYESLRA
jgi:glycosyltransferase involved in cell wall biosynthesis